MASPRKRHEAKAAFERKFSLDEQISSIDRTICGFQLQLASSTSNVQRWHWASQLFLARSKRDKLRLQKRSARKKKPQVAGRIEYVTGSRLHMVQGGAPE